MRLRSRSRSRLRRREGVVERGLAWEEGPFWVRLSGCRWLYVCLCVWVVTTLLVVLFCFVLFCFVLCFGVEVEVGLRLRVGVGEMESSVDWGMSIWISLYLVGAGSPTVVMAGHAWSCPWSGPGIAG